MSLGQDVSRTGVLRTGVFWTGVLRTGVGMCGVCSLTSLLPILSNSIPRLGSWHSLYVCCTVNAVIAVILIIAVTEVILFTAVTKVA